MVRRAMTWECETCGDVHFTYDAARGCELGHIVDRAAERVSKAIRHTLRENPNG